MNLKKITVSLELGVWQYESKRKRPAANTTIIHLTVLFGNSISGLGSLGIGTVASLPIFFTHTINKGV